MNPAKRVVEWLISPFVSTERWRLRHAARKDNNKSRDRLRRGPEWLIALVLVVGGLGLPREPAAACTLLSGGIVADCSGIQTGAITYTDASPPGNVVTTIDVHDLTAPISATAPAINLQKTGATGVSGTAGPGLTITTDGTVVVTTTGNDNDGILAVSLGGNGTGTTGGSGGAVTVTNAGQITTQAAGAGGVTAISVAGSSAGGAGASAGVITITNSGAIVTEGGTSDGGIAPSFASFAHGILAVSGSNDGTNGGAGGAGSTLSITHSGSISTAGIGSFGILVINAGGAGGLGSANAAGGAGGIGGDTNVSVTGSGTIQTSGAGDLAIYAGSFGGNGGVGGPTTGTGGAGAAGGTVTITLGSATSLMTQGDNAVGVYAQSSGGLGATGGGGGLYPAPGGGGPGGSGGDVTVTAQGVITTSGLLSHGILAESVGGNGGGGGVSTQSAGVIRFVRPLVGAGAPAAAGGDITVVNSGNIITGGDFAIGIVAGSIGGGGGAGGASGSNQQVGGTANAGGVGGVVEVTNSAGAGITTSGSFGIGVLGLSVGGGGGNAAGASQINRLGASATGLGGAGGEVTLTNSGRVTTAGDGGFGMLGLSVGGGGGNAAGAAVSNIGANGGAASNGGAVQLTNTATGLIATSGDAAYGLFGISVGGGGGVGGNASGTKAIGGTGGAGGNGGSVTIDNHGLITTDGENAHGIFGISVGGGGGDGGYAKASAGIFETARAIGGSGNVGGNGGIVSITNSGSVVTIGAETDAIFALSVGGGGGNAGDAKASSGFLSLGASSIGGTGGAGGVGGYVSVANTGTILMDGEQSTGVFAISVGGGGGKGGDATTTTILSAGYSRAIGGNGGGGGVGGVIELTNGGAIAVSGERSIGLVALSVGGGGGWGGDATVASIINGFGLTSAIGGSGANGGGNGGDITITNTGAIAMEGKRTDAIFALSVGGGGGFGGDAVAGSVLGTVASSVGGSGTGGGVGGVITVTNSGGISVDGDRSNAIFALSVGGGGGFGGDAITANILSGSSLTSSVGGTGGGGGAGGAVSVHNDGAIMVTGYRSDAIVALSVGGGGGWGGTAINVNALNAVAVTATVGGSGASGGAGASVNVVNDGLIFTDGDRSSAVLALSVGGGGGVGGMGLGITASAAAFNVAVGGKGGAGNNGGTVTVNQSGTTLTEGYNSYGIVAASVGGGGGMGGDSLANTLTGSPKLSVAATVSVGGSGGAGGAGGTVTVGNTGNILTLGGGSDAVYAQSIGGGGGNGGDASAASKVITASSNASISVVVGGRGVGGGAGGNVTVNTSGLIITVGDDSRGIFAQSVGGGGGDGGLGRATAAASVSNPAVTALKELYADHKAGQAASKPTAAGKATQDAKTAEKFEPEPTAVEIAIAVGGSGGVGGGGGIVSVTNNGIINTFGYGSHGIFAQSIGGGGGVGGGGAAATTGGAGNSVGGSFNAAGGGGRDGGAVTVNNTGEIITFGGSAFGIFAQSVGNGGGIALSGDELGGKQKLSINVGGSGGFAGAGGNVTVNQQGDVATQGDDSAAVFAQSIGGGGGVGSAGAGGTDQSIVVGGTGGAGGDGGIVGVAVTGNVLTLGDFAHGVVAQSVGDGGGFGGESKGGTLTVGGSGAGAGKGGAVNVTVSGTIVTEGFASFGVLAQSIGGGGGVAGSHQDGGATLAIVGGNGGGGGNGGDINVLVTGNILTQDDGSHALFAQSVGGGGGIGGDLTGVALAKGVGVGGTGGSAGNGGVINIVSAGTIVTEGFRAYGIFAQSIGGGGGIGGGGALSQSYAGSNGGAGNGGAITISHTGNIIAEGVDAHGIFAQSQGGTGLAANAGNIGITLGGGIVQGGTGVAAGISIDGGNINTITIGSGGTVTALSDIALQATGHGSTTVNNAGVVIGNVDLGSGSSPFNNQTTGIFAPKMIVNLSGGQLTNDGLINLGGTNQVIATALTGKFVQSVTGTFAVDARFGNGVSDLMSVTGTANVRGFIKPYATYLMPNQLATVLTAAGGFTGTNDATAINSPVVTYGVQFNGNDLQLSVQSANFLTPSLASGLTSNQYGVATHFQNIWNAGGSAALAGAMGYLGNLSDPAAYGAVLGRLTPQPYLAQPIGAIAAGTSFVDGMMSCRSAGGSFAAIAEKDCVWVKVAGGSARQAGGGNNMAYEEYGSRIQAGTQFQVSPGWFVGYGVGYEGATTNAVSTASRVERHTAGVVIKRQDGPLLLAAAVDAGYASISSVRSIDFPTPGLKAKSDSYVWSMDARFRAVYLFEAGRAYVKPSAEFDVIGVHMPGFSEAGAGGLNLNVSSLSQAMLAATPGLEVGASFNSRSGATVIRPFAYGGVTWYSDTNWQFTSTFQGTPGGVNPFVTTNTFPDMMYKLSTGVELISAKPTGGLDLRFHYDGQFARGFQSHTGALKASVRY